MSAKRVQPLRRWDALDYRMDRERVQVEAYDVRWGAYYERLADEHAARCSGCQECQDPPCECPACRPGD